MRVPGPVERARNRPTCSPRSDERIMEKLARYLDPAEAAAELIVPQDRFAPDPERARRYDEKLAQYRELYPAIKAWQRKVGFRTETGT